MTPIDPCPFCGSKTPDISTTTVGYHTEDYVVRCTQCGAHGPVGGLTWGEAVDLWNTRTAPR